jgi:hypothetical protein
MNISSNIIDPGSRRAERLERLTNLSFIACISAEQPLCFSASGLDLRKLSLGLFWQVNYYGIFAPL